MNFTATLTRPTYLAEDRALGTEAEVLRNLLQETVATVSRERASETLSRLVQALRHAKDSHGITVSLITFDKTLQFMISLPTELPLPTIVVESEEEIGLDWAEDPQRVVSLTIDNSDRIGFAALFGREPIYGRVDYIHGLPQTLHYVLTRMYPSAQFHYQPSLDRVGSRSLRRRSGQRH